MLFSLSSACPSTLQRSALTLTTPHKIQAIQPHTPGEKS